jgi:hypothetical protein
MARERPVVVLLGYVDDKFCANPADSDGLDLVDVYLALDGCVGEEVLLVPLRLYTPKLVMRIFRSCFFL